jgi:hypothetical protein
MSRRHQLNDRTGESGQVLVIFAGGMLTLLVVAALVIDLGFTMAIRRSEQDAADAGAIAAARFIKTGVGGTAEPTRMRQAACFYAEQNGFFPAAAGNVDGCIPANDPNATTLTVNYPPSAGGGSFVGTDGYVEVGLTRVHRSFLAGMVGLGSLRVSTSAVAAFTTGQSNSSSLIALDPSNNCSAGKVHGGGVVNIHPVVAGTAGGYVHVNSTCNNGPPSGTCDNTGNGGLTIVGSATLNSPHAYVAGTCKGNPSQVPNLTEGAVQIGDPLAELPRPRLTDYPNGQCGPSGVVTTAANPVGCTFTADVTLNPGVYYGGWVIKNKVVLTLNPGMYIIAGNGIDFSGSGEIDSVVGGSGPAPVMIFNTDSPTCPTGPCQGRINFTAQSDIFLRPINSGPYKGMLIWNDGTVRNLPPADVLLLAGANLDIGGTVYSPKGFVKVDGGGAAAGSAAVQVIAWTFDVGGNAGLDMPYDPAGLYQFPAKGLVH